MDICAALPYQFVMHPNTVMDRPLTVLKTNTPHQEVFAVKPLENVTLQKHVPETALHVLTIHTLKLAQFAEIAKDLEISQNHAMVIHPCVRTTSGELVKFATKSPRSTKHNAKTPLPRKLFSRDQYKTRK